MRMALYLKKNNMYLLNIQLIFYVQTLNARSTHSPRSTHSSTPGGGRQSPSHGTAPLMTSTRGAGHVVPASPGQRSARSGSSSPMGRSRSLQSPVSHGEKNKIAITFKYNDIESLLNGILTNDDR